MKISLERDAFLVQLQTVTRVASTRSAIQALSGVQLRADESGCELRATDTDVSLRVPLDAQTRPSRGRDSARATAGRCRQVAAVTGGLAGAARRRARRRGRLGECAFPHPNVARRGLPAVPRAGPGDRGLAAGSRVHADGRQGCGLGVARRDTPGADRDPRVGGRAARCKMVATDSYRLSVKETLARRRARRAASRSTCRRARCRSSRGSPHTPRTSR